MATISSSMPLYLCSNIADSSIPLFIQTEVPSELASSLPLFTYGDGGNTVNFAAIPLYINSVSGIDNVEHSYLNLFLKNEETGATSKSMNLFIDGQHALLTGDIPLFLKNGGENKQLPLFISGEGTTAGAIPFTGSMNLFLRLAPSDSIPLYLRGPGDVYTGSVDMFIKGGVYASGTVNLSIPNVIGEADNRATLFISGW